jgi:hypothetical protein
LAARRSGLPFHLNFFVVIHLDLDCRHASSP